jgi:hypothetical protein
LLPKPFGRFIFGRFHSTLPDFFHSYLSPILRFLLSTACFSECLGCQTAPRLTAGARKSESLWKRWAEILYPPLPAWPVSLSLHDPRGCWTSQHHSCAGHRFRGSNLCLSKKLTRRAPQQRIIPWWVCPHDWVPI